MTGGSRLMQHRHSMRGPEDAVLTSHASVHDVRAFAAAGYEPVRDAFVDAVGRCRGSGGAFAATRHGRLVVDVWGGDTGVEGAAWQRGTPVMIFSGTKGLLGACLLALVDAGELQPHRPVAHYWPDFGHKGKGTITISDLVTHRAGLPGIVKPLTTDEILDSEAMAKLLAAQAPADELVGRLCYHPLTWGWMCDELIQRVTGTRASALWRKLFGDAFDLDVWIGAPASLCERIATLELTAGDPSGPSAVPTGSWYRSVYENPDIWTQDAFPWNTTAYRTAGIPGAGAVGTARSIARLYALLCQSSASGGALSWKPGTAKLARCGASRGLDPITGREFAFSFGFQVQTADHRFGPVEHAFGMDGFGGSCHGAWPDLDIGFSYCRRNLFDDGGSAVNAMLSRLHSAAQAEDANV